MRSNPMSSLLLLAGLSLPAGAALVEVAPDHPSIRLLGRYGKDSYSADIQWSWSASGASIAFAGTSCAIRMQAQGAIYGVAVDGKETKVLDLSNAYNDTLFDLASGLNQGPHTVAVRLRTEAQYSLTHFRGFRIDGTPGVAAPGPQRRIEFYGNSITCGYGILDSVAGHSFKVQTEHEGLTYAALAADSLGAERHTICWSGRGVVQNYNGDTKSPTLPRMYNRILTWDTTVVWDFAKWIPQVVVIDLGTNDYSTSSAQPDSAKFYRTYLAFVDTLHAKYPMARFVLVDGPMMSDGYPAGLNTLTKLRNHLKAIVANVTARGIQATHLSLTPQDDTRGYGADYHPNRAQARLNGEELAAHLRQVMPEWSGASTLPGSRLAGSAWTISVTNGTIRNGGPSSVRATLRDVFGARTWSAEVPSGSSVSIPGSRAIRWILVESDAGSRILSIAPDLR